MNLAPESRLEVLKNLREINVEWTSEPRGESLLVASLLVGSSEQVANAGFASVIMAQSLSD